MKRFVSPLILIVALLMVGFVPQMALAQGNRTGTSAVTVTVQEYIDIPASLPAMTIIVTAPGTDATGTSIFDVNANVATTISVGTITDPTTPTPLTGLAATVSFTGTTPGTKAVTLTGEINVPMTKAVGSYTGGSITVTVTAS